MSASRALVWTGPDRFELRDRPERPPGPKEALVRVKAAGLSALDLRLLSGGLPIARPPKVLGHEVAGVVESAPQKDWVGRRVVVDPAIGCGRCAGCRANRRHLCDQGGFLGTTGPEGGFADLVLVPIANLTPLPEAASFESGTFVEPLARALGALDRAQAREGEAVLVLGGGAEGLLHVQLARARECPLIFWVGGGKASLQAATALGATHAWGQGSGFLQDLILSYTSGHGPDLAIETSGAPASVGQAFSFVRKGGRVILSAWSGSFEKDIPSDTLVSKDLTAVTGAASPALRARAIALVETQKIDVAALVTHRFGLDRAEEALRTARDPDASIQVLFTP